MAAVLEIFGLGACLLHGPMSAAMQQGAAKSTFARLPGGVMPAVYCIEDTIQLLRYMAGDFDIPERLRPFCAIPQGLVPACLRGGGFAGADVAIVEVNSPVRVAYGEYSLGRTEIMDRVFAPLRDRGRAVQQAIDIWYYKGLMSADPTAGRAASEVLIAAVSDEMADADLARSILAEARGERCDVGALADAIATVRDVVGVPLGMTTYTHQYLPDGRPMPWPPDFVDQQIEAATRLEIPYFQPSRLVRHHGVAQALAADRIHYQDEFQPVVGEALVQFAAHVCNRPYAEPPARPGPASEPAAGEPGLWELPPPYRHGGGRLWRADLPPELHGATDTGEAPQRSRLHLFEDGRELAPGHSDHAMIENYGRGRHSFWHTTLYFSPSDDSDPNANGRCYKAAFR